MQIGTRTSYIASLRLISFGIPKAAKMRQTLTEPKEVTLHSNSNNPTSEHAPHVERKYQYCKQNNRWKS